MGQCPSSEACLYRHDPSVQHRRMDRRGGAPVNRYGAAGPWLDLDEYSDDDDAAAFGIFVDEFFENPFVFSDFYADYEDYVDLYDDDADFFEGSSDDEYLF